MVKVRHMEYCFISAASKYLLFHSHNNLPLVPILFFISFYQVMSSMTELYNRHLLVKQDKTCANSMRLNFAAIQSYVWRPHSKSNSSFIAKNGQQTQPLICLSPVLTVYGFTDQSKAPPSVILIPTNSLSSSSHQINFPAENLRSLCSSSKSQFSVL